jgi:formamidopyrimidine-DNA glycosylase
MPELPEVEILKRELSTTVLHKTIDGSYQSNKKFKRLFPELNILKNSTIKNIFRRNKYLILELNEKWLVIHLGMTGQLIFSSSLVLGKHTHFYFKFNDGTHLKFDDPRRFGSVDLYDKTVYSDYLKIPLFKNLGMEPLDSSFTFSKFHSYFNSSKNIKNFIMDAQYVCGIGNIYASEILFLSKISPTRLVKNINIKEQKLLFKLIPQVLQTSINLGGSSISDFVHTNGTTGSMQQFYNTYGRNGKPCKACNNNIEKIVQNGRSTFYCPSCQK